MDTATQLQQTERRAPYECGECGARFFGGKAATEWIDHTTPWCRAKAAQEKQQRERDAKEAADQQVEDTLTIAVQDSIEKLGYTRTIEAIARAVENEAEHDEANQDSWTIRAEALFEAAEVGDDYERT